MDDDDDARWLGEGIYYREKREEPEDVMVISKHNDTSGPFSDGQSCLLSRQGGKLLSISGLQQ